MADTRNFRIRWIFPIAELWVCGMLFWPWTTLTAGILHGRPAEILATMRFSIPLALNLPCGIIGFARREAVPAAVLPDMWRAMIWPFVGVIFWWIAGRSFDALLAARQHEPSPRITWIEVCVPAVIVAVSSLLLFGFASDPSMRDEFIMPWRTAVGGSVLWVFLGATTIAARLVQWRIRRRLRTQAIALGA
jgi:hypothetical protein